MSESLLAPAATAAKTLWEELLAFKPVLTVLTLVLFFVLVSLVERWSRRLQVAPEQRRKAVRLGRLAVTLVVGTVLVTIWAAKLRSVGLVLSGFAVGLIIATKEVIMCITGFWVKMAGNTFRLGDVVAVKGVRGKVLDFGLLTTTLLLSDHESDKPAGHTVTLPNSVYLSETVYNESRWGPFVRRAIVVSTPVVAQWRQAEASLLAAAEQVWQQERGALEAASATLQDERGIHFEVTPRVRLKKIEKDQVLLEVSLALPADRQRELEDMLLRSYLEKLGEEAESKGN